MKIQLLLANKSIICALQHLAVSRKLYIFCIYFFRYDIGKDGFLDLEELKRMMEKIGAPQTHLGLKAMIKEVDEDDDGKISFREFLLIYRKAEAGELTEESGLSQLAKLTEINVDEVGVNGAKNFFEAKVSNLPIYHKKCKIVKKYQIIC